MNTLTAIGTKAVAFIYENIDNRVDSNGKPFEPYSFNYWFYKYRRRRYKGKKLRTKQGKKKWQQFLIASRSEWETEKNNVTLSDTNSMLTALDVISVSTSSFSYLPEIKIGFRDQEAAKKAFYHNVSGAGKGRTLRRFLGLQPAQIEELEVYAGDLIGKDKLLLIGLIKELGLELT